MRKGLLINLDRCSGCDSCVVCCKLEHSLPLGSAYNKVKAMGPFGTFPNVEKYWLPVQCQQCENAPCLEVCPTGATYREDEYGLIVINQEQCIGCQACVSACPYGVRYLNEDLNVVQKCTMCHDTVEQGELPACVRTCGGRARFFGDLDKGIDSFEAPWVVDVTEGDPSYDKTEHTRITLKECVQEYKQSDVHHLPDVGNGPGFVYILRDRDWQGEE